ncbi:MAG TPA: hypothetical protein PLD20_20240 [Blastocatellia bacterium]|nr:hypothetical protein [Blastocatellia bacterium]HMY71517.1 hypothetical protein [Blastocatellia bacterium]HMZ20277.1 hypothetical protein [Blastocatellia bacterium]HNG29253.1 hypothetical protein [Blastocatellia bacterium]
MTDQHKVMNKWNDNPAEREMAGYLLGEMSEQEQADFEMRYLADDSMFEQTLTVKQELIDAYVRNHLDAATREKFERHFLATPEGQKEVAFARALREKLTAPVLNAPVVTEPAKLQPSKLSAWLAGWTLREIALATATGLLLVAGGGLFIQNRKLRSEVSELKTEAAVQARHNAALQEQLARQQSPNPSPSPLPNPSPEATVEAYNFLAINLSPDTAREPGDITPLKASADNQRPRLRLALNFKLAGLSCNLTLQTPSGTKFERRNLRARHNATGYFVTAEFPDVTLQPGTYRITIRGRDDDDKQEVTLPYHFRIAPPGKQ